MVSKLVSDRQKSSAAVAAAAHTHAAKVASSIENLLSPHLKKGETMPDVALLIALAERALTKSATELEQADVAHELELSDDRGPREARDEAAGALYAKLVEAREIAQGILGSAGVAALGLAGTTPRDPTQLGQLARTLAATFRVAKVPKSRIKGASFHIETWATEIEEHAKPLATELKTVARETREAEATLAKKQQAIAAFDATFSAVANCLGALLNLAGEKELAARVRPSTRRPGRTSDEESDGEGAAPAPVTPPG